MKRHSLWKNTTLMTPPTPLQKIWIQTDWKLDNSKLGSTQQWMTLTCCQDHILTENIWFVWSETSYRGDERRCNGRGTNERTNEQTLKIELLSQWKLEAEFRNSEREKTDWEPRSVFGPAKPQAPVFPCTQDSYVFSSKLIIIVCSIIIDNHCVQAGTTCGASSQPDLIQNHVKIFATFATKSAVF